MNKQFHLASTVAAVILTGSLFSGHAQGASKEQVIENAPSVCEQSAINRYGADSVKAVGKRVKWSKGLGGATVTMKIKPKAKKSRKYTCVVSLENTAKFFKA